jgi:hypothetical protein
LAGYRQRYIKGGTQLLDRSCAHSRTIGRPGPPNSPIPCRAAWRRRREALPDHLEPIAIGIMAWTPSLMLAPFLAFFFLRDGRRFSAFSAAPCPMPSFEKTLFLLHEIDRTSRAYFQGLIKLTVLDTL